MSGDLMPSVAFDTQQARRNRDAAIAKVQLGSGKAGWIKAARWAVYSVAKEHQEFTTDDVWATGLPQCPGSNRALGPVMLAAARAEIIRRTERTRPTSKRASHAQPLRVWESSIYDHCTQGGQHSA